MTKVLATFGTGPAAEMLALVLPGFRAYADRHGYDLHIGDGFSDGRPPSWGKVPLFLKLLERYEEVLWIDSDVIIADGSEDLAADVPPWAIQALSFSRRMSNVPRSKPPRQQLNITPNCGVWYVRPPMRPWLKRVWEMTAYTDHAWWEQAAVMELLGFKIVNLIGLPPAQPTELLGLTCELDSCWNYHPVLAGTNNRPPKFWHAMGHGEHKRHLVRQWASGDLAPYRGAVP